MGGWGGWAVCDDGWGKWEGQVEQQPIAAACEFCDLVGREEWAGQNGAFTDAHV